MTALLKAGADPWLGDMSVRRTCVHYAAGKGHVQVVQAIVEWVRHNAPMEHYKIPPEYPATMWVLQRVLHSMWALQMGGCTSCSACGRCRWAHMLASGDAHLVGLANGSAAAAHGQPWLLVGSTCSSNHGAWACTQHHAILGEPRSLCPDHACCWPQFSSACAQRNRHCLPCVLLAGCMTCQPRPA